MSPCELHRLSVTGTEKSESTRSKCCQGRLTLVTTSTPTACVRPTTTASTTPTSVPLEALLPASTIGAGVATLTVVTESTAARAVTGWLFISAGRLALGLISGAGLILCAGASLILAAGAVLLILGLVVLLVESGRRKVTAASVAVKVVRSIVVIVHIVAIVVVSIVSV